MDYYDYREMRSLALQARLLNYRIDLERKETKPNLFRISQLRNLLLKNLERLAGFSGKHSPA